MVYEYRKRKLEKTYNYYFIRWERKRTLSIFATHTKKNYNNQTSILFSNNVFLNQLLIFETENMFLIQSKFSTSKIDVILLK